VARALVLTAAVVAALAAASIAGGAATASTQAVRLDCGTRVLAVVFLPGKRLVDIGAASHLRLLVADPGDVVWRKTCKRSLGRTPVWEGAHAATTRTTRLGCVFPSRIQFAVVRARTGIKVLAARPGSDRALLRADLAQHPRLEYDRRYCRAL
jgi:hypothetical protein